MEADDVFANKISATEEIAFGVTLVLSDSRKISFSASFFPSVSLSLCTALLYVFVYKMSHQRWMWGVTLANLEVVLESFIHVTTPGLMDSQTLTAASANVDQAKHCAVQEQKEKHVPIMIYLAMHKALKALTHSFGCRRVTKTPSKFIFVRRL